MSDEEVTMAERGLIRHRTVLQADPLTPVVNPNGLHVPLSQVNEDTGMQTVIAYLERSDWEEMGEPVEVTVTFEPGNVLQAEQDAELAEMGHDERRGDRP